MLGIKVLLENGNLIACLSTHKHSEINVPLFAFTSKLATTISKGLFPRHEVFKFMCRVDPLWQRRSSLFHRYAKRAFLSVRLVSYQSRFLDEATLLF